MIRSQDDNQKPLEPPTTPSTTTTSHTSDTRSLTSPATTTPASTMVRSRSSSRGTASTSMKKMSLKRQLMRMNVSISSISEDEPIVSFNDSGMSSMSSLSFLTCSGSSLMASSTSILGPVTQGPSLFDEGKSGSPNSKSSSAPKMPRRGTDSSNHRRGKNPFSPRWNHNTKFTSQNCNGDTETNEHDDEYDCDNEDDDDYDEDDSNGSLTLDDILEESNHSSSTATTTATGRQWTDTAQVSGMHMPLRNVSNHNKNSHSNHSRYSSHTSTNLNNSVNSWGFDSSTSVLLSDDDDEEDDLVDEAEGEDNDEISYTSASSSFASLAGDSFSQLKISAAHCSA